VLIDPWFERYFVRDPGAFGESAGLYPIIPGGQWRVCANSPARRGGVAKNGRRPRAQPADAARGTLPL